jgi:hypothetical protein
MDLQTKIGVPISMQDTVQAQLQKLFIPVDFVDGNKFFYKSFHFLSLSIP